MKNKNKICDVRVVMNQELLEKIRTEAKQDKRTMSNFINKMLTDYFEEKELKNMESKNESI